MKKKKKRGLLLFLMSIVLGGFLGMFVGMFKALAESHGIMLDVKPLIPWLSAISLLLAVIILFLTFNFLNLHKHLQVLYVHYLLENLLKTFSYSFSFFTC